MGKMNERAITNLIVYGAGWIDARGGSAAEGGFTQEGTRQTSHARDKFNRQGEDAIRG